MEISILYQLFLEMLIDGKVTTRHELADNELADNELADNELADNTRHESNKIRAGYY